MANWIEVKARYDRLMENGVTKKVNEPYLVDALSCSEAEARVVDELRPFVSGDLNITSTAKTKVAEVFTDGKGDRYYRVKVNFITIDERTAAEKRTASYIIVEAIDFPNAIENFNDGMRGTLADFEIESIAETKYIDVYPYAPAITKAQLKAMLAAKSKPNKYGARRSGGYDSTKEHRRACELQLMQRAGLISGLREQVRFELIPAQQGERSCSYIADFVYTDVATGQTVVEDTKGVRTKEYIIKRKLMLFIHGIRIKEV